MPHSPISPIPVAIVTGFLGSGKTTFLNWLLSQSGASRVAVIVNEFGEIGLDHLLIATPVENIMLVEGGCLCCEVRGDLVQTLTDLVDRRDRGEIEAFDRVVIETSGLSNPIPIIQTVLCDETVRDRFCLSKIITLVDAVNAPAQTAQHIEAVRQIAVADMLLISKQDLATAEAQSRVRAELQSINPGARQVDVLQGSPEGISAQALLADDQTHNADAFLSWMAHSEAALAQRADGPGLWAAGALRPSAHRLESAQIESFSLRREGEISSSSTVMWLNLLATMKGERLLRLKAILNVEGRPVAIHAAQTIVHEPITLHEWPTDDRSSRFVVISQGSIRAEFERSLAALDFSMPAPQKTPTIDPEAYRRFLQLAEAMSKPPESVSSAPKETV